MDLSKVFDTVEHNMLRNKLTLHVIKINSFNWFSSYLSRRKNLVQAGIIKARNLSITFAVPQGAI